MYDRTSAGTNPDIKEVKSQGHGFMKCVVGMGVQVDMTAEAVTSVTQTSVEPSPSFPNAWICRCHWTVTCDSG